MLCKSVKGNVRQAVDDEWQKSSSTVKLISRNKLNYKGGLKSPPLSSRSRREWKRFLKHQLSSAREDCVHLKCTVRRAPSSLLKALRDWQLHAFAKKITGFWHISCLFWLKSKLYANVGGWNWPLSLKWLQLWQWYLLACLVASPCLSCLVMHLCICNNPFQINSGIHKAKFHSL